MSPYFRGKRGLVPQSSTWTPHESSDEESEFEEEVVEQTPPVPVVHPKFGGKRFVGKGAAMAYKAAFANPNLDSEDSDSESEYDEVVEHLPIQSIPERLAAEEAARQAAEASSSVNEDESVAKPSNAKRVSAGDTYRRNSSLLDLGEPVLSMPEPVAAPTPPAPSKMASIPVSKSQETFATPSTPPPPPPPQTPTKQKVVSRKSPPKKAPAARKKAVRAKKPAAPKKSPTKSFGKPEALAKRKAAEALEATEPVAKKAKKEPTIAEIMAPISVTLKEIPKLSEWAEKNGRGNEDIVHRLVTYMKEIGEFILDKSSSAKQRTEMWAHGAKLAEHQAGGAHLCAIYQQMEIELSEKELAVQSSNSNSPV